MKETEQTLLDRFEAKIYYAIDSCWYWTGCVCKFGYGRIRVNGVSELSTRISYTLFKGGIPDGMYVCHRCDNPACVNPDHLFLGSQSDNMKDMMNKGRRGYYGEENPRTKLKESDILTIRSGAFTVTELMTKYQMTYSGVWNIIHRRSWTKLQ